MLGSVSEADTVQERWLRLSRADTRSVANLGGWLTRELAPRSRLRCAARIQRSDAGRPPLRPARKSSILRINGEPRARYFEEDRRAELSAAIAVLHSGARPTARFHQFRGVSPPHRGLERSRPR